MAIVNTFVDKFSYRPVQNLVRYSLTQNCESQAVVCAGAETEIDDTGTKGVIINGVPVILPVDTDYETADVAYADWAVSTAYTVAGLISEVVVEQRHFTCILAHTSSSVATVAGDKPLIGVNWRTYWREMDTFAVQAFGDSIPAGNVTTQTRYYLICAIAAGNLRAFKAYTGTGAATVQIPAFDPSRWVAVALVKLVWVGAGAYVWHTGNWNQASMTATIQQLVGPIFPDADVIDKN
jgi:hypothetical protein